MRFRGEVIYCHATPVRDARLPSDAEHKQPRFAVLGLYSSLQSIRAAHDGSTLLTPRFHPAYGYNPSLVTSVTGGPGQFTANLPDTAHRKFILHSAFCILHFISCSGVVPTVSLRRTLSPDVSLSERISRFLLRQSSLTVGLYHRETGLSSGWEERRGSFGRKTAVFGLKNFACENLEKNFVLLLTRRRICGRLIKPLR